MGRRRRGNLIDRGGQNFINCFKSNAENIHLRMVWAFEASNWDSRVHGVFMDKADTLRYG